MTCPACAAELPPNVPTVRGVVIAPCCLRSLVIEGEDVRLAVDSDTTVLTDAEIATLKAHRKAARKAKGA